MAESSSKKINLRLIIPILIIAAFLRLWRLGDVPVSMYLDELDLGYQAYSIIETGSDYFGNAWPLHFHSYGEYRTPFNIYTAIPTVAIFGISPYGVRLPSVIFGILSVLVLYLLVRELGSLRLAEIAALVLAVSPWHVHFSRVALEVSPLIFFVITGLFFFLKSFNNSKYFLISVFLFGLTPWIYSPAKLFMPLFFITLVFLWRKEIIKFPKKLIIYCFIILLLLGVPLLSVITSGKAGMRFNYISVFSDPTVPTGVNYAREFDAFVRGEAVVGTRPSIFDKFFHNKITFWKDRIVGNYIQAVSSDFLFVKGDPNLRHSAVGVGQFYKIEIIPFLLGLIIFFMKYKDRKIKMLLAFWIILGILPSALTRDGGNHAGRLIIILPPLIFMIAYGVDRGIKFVDKSLKKYVAFLFCVLWVLSIVFYLHNYFVHYPLDSERVWDAGYKEMIDEVKKRLHDYEKIVISNKYESPELYFAAYYPYDPRLWQKGLESANLEGAKVSKTGKFYFGQYGDITEVNKYLDKDTLYIVSAKEVDRNLIRQPSYTPEGLNLVTAVAYPSGEPVFYAFEKINSGW